MPTPTTTATARARLAQEISEFWWGGEGPSHGEITTALAVAGVHTPDGDKRDRVATAIRDTPDQALFTLVDQLVYCLRRWSLPNADPAVLTRVRAALRPFGFVLDDDVELRQTTAAPADRVPDVPELRDHADRIHRAIRDGDSAQLLGSTKELLETTAKLVLAHTGQTVPTKFPALVTAALQTLHLHPKENPSDGTPAEAAVRRILGGNLQIVLGIDELRNLYGTGHGHLEASRLSARHARLAAGAGITAVTLILDTLDDPDAPWRATDG